MAMQKDMMGRAVRDSFAKLDPRVQIQNPVMFLVWLSAVMTSVLAVASIFGVQDAGVPTYYVVAIAVILWLTDLFSNFAEALAEGRGKAQADSLRAAKKDVEAHRIESVEDKEHFTVVPGTELTRGDLVIVRAGEQIPGDGDVIEGAASVDESAITGESAPVVRESGGDFCSVTGGTTVVSDWLKIRITSEPGNSFLDRMIALVEGASRKKTPNEIALNTLLVSLTIIFLVVVVTMYPFAVYSGVQIPISTLIALLVCLIPTTIGGLLSAIGISGIDRLVRRNVLATSGRAVEAAGDIDVLMLDKTGTITFGNRMANEFLPAPGVEEQKLAEAAQLASLSDETPEGRSIVVLAKKLFGIRGSHMDAEHVAFVPFSASTRMSGVDIAGHDGQPAVSIRKGAAESVAQWVKEQGGTFPQEVEMTVQNVARAGGTPLVVARGRDVLGVIYLKDIVKGGIKERFARLRAMGIRTVMVTGDNALTAASIAAEAGVDDFMAEATPEMKLARIREEQAAGHLVAMTGDGTNDAPALAQADVGVAMNTGTQAAREAGNMVDLDSNPTKLIEIVEIGKQLLITRGALTTFSFANDVAKYFAIIPAMFAGLFVADGMVNGPLSALNVMGLHSPQSAILSAVIFNALIIVALIPLALKGVSYRPSGAASLLKRNILIYGVGGLIAPFIGIKLIDMAVTALHLV